MKMKYEEFKNYLDRAQSMTDEQLHIVISEFTKCLENRKQAEREEFRQKLMENLQDAINNILANGFTLTIENDERDAHDIYQGVIIDPNEEYSLLLEDEE